MQISLPNLLLEELLAFFQGDIINWCFAVSALLPRGLKYILLFSYLSTYKIEGIVELTWFT